MKYDFYIKNTPLINKHNILALSGQCYLSLRVNESQQSEIYSYCLHTFKDMRAPAFSVERIQKAPLKL